MAIWMGAAQWAGILIGYEAEPIRFLFANKSIERRMFVNARQKLRIAVADRGLVPCADAHRVRMRQIRLA